MQDEDTNGEAYGSYDLWYKLYETVRSYERERDLYYLSEDFDTKEGKGLFAAYLDIERFARTLFEGANTLLASDQSGGPAGGTEPAGEMEEGTGLAEELIDFLQKMIDEIETVDVPPEEKAKLITEFRIDQEIIRRINAMGPRSKRSWQDLFEGELRNLKLLRQLLEEAEGDNLPPEIKAEIIKEAAESPGPRDVESPLHPVSEQLCLHLAEEALERIKKGIPRVFDLYELVSYTRPSKATQSFLARLGRCYVWGFDSECVILCRAVLDTAFRDAVDDTICIEYWGPGRGNHPRQFGLNDRIFAAWKNGIIDEETRELARKIKIRGDTAVHYQPNVTKEVLDTIRGTVAVLEQINMR